METFAAELFAQVEEAEGRAENADRFLHGPQPGEIDLSAFRDEILAPGECAEHVAERRMRRFVGMRSDDQKRPGGQPGQTPAFPHCSLVDFQRLEMVLPESFARRAAGAEGLSCLRGGKASQVGLLEGILRNAGNLPPIHDLLPHPETLAKSAVR